MKSEHPSIKLYEAYENNLKIDFLEIPSNALVCITGLSGSGKSSLAFETIYAEGQRRYIESLSAYARQFFGKIKKPKIKHIDNIAPAIAIEQRNNVRTPRSTVGTITEIYDFIKLLYAKIGKIISPVSGKIIKKHSPEDVYQFLETLSPQDKIYILVPFPAHTSLKALKAEGFTRILMNNSLIFFENINDESLLQNPTVFLFIDRSIMQENKNETIQRLKPSIELAFNRFEQCVIYIENKQHYEYFSSSLFQEGIQYVEPSVELLSFNHTLGACPTCSGYGTILGIDPELVIPNPNLSVFEGAIAPWRGEKSSELLRQFLSVAHKYNFPVHTPYKDLTEEQKHLLWNGGPDFWGINQFFDYLAQHPHKIQHRIMIAKYRGRTICPDCKGTRLRKEALWIKLQGKNIAELSRMQINHLYEFFKNLTLTPSEVEISKNILQEINNRLSFLMQTGLEYLTLDRPASTLSGGEMQRIQLTRALGSNLTGSIYILDEPTIGMHPYDVHKLIHVLMNLRDLGNTVLVVEHDEEVIRHSDFIIELGPEAGSNGGKVVFSGTVNELIQSGNTHTAQYLRQETLPPPAVRRKSKYAIHLKHASRHNLKNIDVSFPLHLITAISGVSGSGKSTLIHYELVPALLKYLNQPSPIQPTASVEGDLQHIKDIVVVDQKPLTASSRSNPATYIKAFDDIRTLFSQHPLSQKRRYTPKHFSFNSPGGRCETCQGTGEIEIEMQFLPNVKIVCETCHGKRYKDEILEVEIQGKNLYDILSLTIDDAIIFLDQLAHPPYHKWAHQAVQKLQVLQQIGLGYIQVGQNLSTLSGGELQRLKLASFLQKASTEDTLFIFDEPTTGLHYYDIQKLYTAMVELIKRRNTIIFIEHNMELIKYADYIIELGPEGGEKGGYVIFQGNLEGILHVENSKTAQFLRKKL